MYPASQPGSKRHTLSVLVENRPGVLARIAGLFARRAFNINSLSVSPTERPDISRVTVTADVDEVPESLTIEATGAEGKIDALLGLLEHYGVIELVRSGAVAVTRGPKALSEKVIGSEITGR